MKPSTAISSDTQLHDNSPEQFVQRSLSCPDNISAPLTTPFPSIGSVSQQIFNSVQEGIVVYGTDLRYLIWNPYMEKLSGMHAGEILGRHPQEVFSFLESAGVITNLERALRGESTEEATFKFMLPSSGRIGWASD